LLGHVRVGQEPILDANQILDASQSPDDPDVEERQANAFALELLTGDSELSFPPAWGLTAAALALKAPELGRKHRINPGTLALHLLT
jgi:Zn-dependent peptidase ImmA (M78 family)